MREIIDFHTHPFINAQRNMCFYDNTVADSDDFVSELKRAGIGMICGSVIERVGEVKDFQLIRDLNDEALALRDRYRGFYIPGIHIHPAFERESLAELERMSEKGVKLIGELVPYMMGWDSYCGATMDKIYKKAAELGMVVSLHTIHEDSIDEAVKNNPQTVFVAAHPGDKAQFYRHIERVKRYDNYYFDLSGTGIFRYGLIAEAVRQVGSERIIFGTDFPICNPSMYVNAVLFEKLTETDLDNIFADNAKRILGKC